MNFLLEMLEEYIDIEKGNPEEEHLKEQHLKKGSLEEENLEENHLNK